MRLYFREREDTEGEGVREKNQRKRWTERVEDVKYIFITVVIRIPWCNMQPMNRHDMVIFPKSTSVAQVSLPQIGIIRSFPQNQHQLPVYTWHNPNGGTYKYLVYGPFPKLNISCPWCNL